MEEIQSKKTQGAEQLVLQGIHVSNLGLIPIPHMV